MSGQGNCLQYHTMERLKVERNKGEKCEKRTKRIRMSGSGKREKEQILTWRPSWWDERFPV